MGVANESPWNPGRDSRIGRTAAGLAQGAAGGGRDRKGFRKNDPNAVEGLPCGVCDRRR